MQICVQHLFNFNFSISFIINYNDMLDFYIHKMYDTMYCTSIMDNLS
jgi:hypothetical protein